MLAARDARWCRREATKEEGAKDCKGHGKEELEVDCGMKIELNPELESLIKQDSKIQAKIEEGYAAAQRGELIDSGEVRSRLELKKRTWLPEKHRP
jgi:hypothetical protein